MYKLDGVAPLIADPPPLKFHPDILKVIFLRGQNLAWSNFLQSYAQKLL